MHKGFDSRLDQAWWALRIGLGVGPFLAGLDKYFNLLTNWTGYISPLALKILPFSGQTFMHIVGGARCGDSPGGFCAGAHDRGPQRCSSE